MRLHISLDDDLVSEIDEHVGRGRRSAFIVRAVRSALDEERRLQLLESAFGAVPDRGHDWDDDPAAWVRAQRRADARAAG